jgi:hypothetical protein
VLVRLVIGGHDRVTGISLCNADSDRVAELKQGCQGKQQSNRQPKHDTRLREQRDRAGYGSVFAHKRLFLAETLFLLTTLRMGRLTALT